MAKLKLDYDCDILVPPTTYTDADRAPVSASLAECRRSSRYKRDVAALPHTVERLKRAQAQARTRRTKKKAG